MNPSQHPSSEDLEDAFSGNLSEAEAELVFTHLEECEICLEQADRLSKRVLDLGEQETQPLLQMPGAAADRIRGDLLRDMRRTELAEDLTRLSSKGALVVVLGLLKPLLAAFGHMSSARKSDRSPS